MHKFYVPSKNIANSEIIITDKEQLKHMIKVLRIAPGSKVGAFDETGNEYLCAVRGIATGKVTLEIKERKAPGAQKIKITIACAIPKKTKMEDIIDKLTQIGVDKIIPLLTERVIVKLDRSKMPSRILRWRKIAQSAAEQSQRGSIPVIDEIKNINEVLGESCGFDLKLIPCLSGRRGPLKEVLLGAHFSNILVLIGPEGDFADGEVEAALKSGFIPVSLGQNVLRVETAAVYVASVISYMLR